MATACTQEEATPAAPRVVRVAHGPGCDFARAVWAISSGPSASTNATSTKNTVELDRDSHLFWNDVAVDETTLRLYTNAVTEIRPQPLTVLRVDPGADCDFFKGVVSDITTAASCTPSTCALEWTSLPHDPRRPVLPPNL